MPVKLTWLTFFFPPVLVMAAIFLAIGFFVFDEPFLWLGIGVLIGLAKVLLLTLGAKRLISKKVGSLPLDPKKDARLYLNIEDLCLAHGFSTPQLRIIKSHNIGVMAYGIRKRNAVVAITIGAQKKLNAVELEAALAHILCRIRMGTTGLQTWALALTKFLPKRRRAAFHRKVFHPDALIDADLRSAELTRYPPASISALQKMTAEDTEDSKKTVDILSFKHYGEERVQALREFWDI